ncbi:MAG: AMP-binding protein [Paramuribaculum sp.]|nr:AMP-binding protein [Paramuribaculum sp.]MDE6322892.1 AMP-binding protein [Paramuribaculum sp.]
MAIIGDSQTICLVERFVELWKDDSDYIEAYTSGSTGVPKMVKLSKSDMELSARATCEFFGVESGSLVFLPLAVDYIAGKMMVVRAEVSGSDIMVEPPSNQPLKTCPSAPIRLAAVVPSQVDGLLASKWVGLIENLIVGGAPLSEADEKKLIDSGINAYATYGMTETCSHVAIRRLGDRYYRALPTVRFSIDERGCLVIHSEVMSFGRLVTNDVVSLLDSKNFEWHGRYDNVINSGGIKVLPENIERKLTDLLRDRTFYITSRPSEKWGDEVVLVVEGDAPVVGLEEYASKFLLKAERPKAVINVGSVSRTSTGKLLRILP